jgi:hypothetical protein
MCHATGLRSSTCRHKWLTITSPCAAGMGFNSLGVHKFHTSHTWFGGTNYFKAPMKSCPDCNKKGQYDGNKIRMVLDYGHDPIKFGGPGGQMGGEYNGYGGYGTGMGGGSPVICCMVM